MDMLTGNLLFCCCCFLPSSTCCLIGNQLHCCHHEIPVIDVFLRTVVLFGPKGSQADVLVVESYSVVSAKRHFYSFVLEKIVSQDFVLL